jgi:sulfotransferase 6B1
VLGIAERLDRYAGWLTSGCLVVRFEDLVGSAGGGDDDSQHAAVSGIYRYLGLEDDDALVRSVCGRLFSSDSPTFRRGSIGGWRDAFDDELEAIFERSVTGHWEPYGYGPSSRAASPTRGERP